jgi:SAM-dependent methyltransferase
MRIVGVLRKVLARLDEVLSKFDGESFPEAEVQALKRYEEIRQFLRALDFPNADARGYVDVHFERIARTLSLVPPSGPTGRVLELGAYMQMTPALACLLGYKDVRAAYYGTLGQVDTKVATAGGREIFRCQIDLFDAEQDVFPYPADYFDAVLACEIIEHLLHDPMHMLLEVQRVLVNRGTLVLTTPNIASFTSVSRLLRANGHPQICSKYANPERDSSRLEVPHVREYTPRELREAVQAAGFEITHLFTEDIGHYHREIWVREFLLRNGYPTDLRGEQIYCVAQKKSGAPINRQPDFLYER